MAPDRLGVRDEPGDIRVEPEALHRPVEDAHTHLGRRLLAGLGAAEDLVHYAVAVLLVIVAGVVLFHSVSDFITNDNPFAEKVTVVINGVLFVIIVMEILRTIVAHFDNA